MKSIFSIIKNKINRSPRYGRTLVVILLIALIIKGIIIYLSFKDLNPLENVISYIASDMIIIFFTQLLISSNYWIKKRKWRLINNFIVFIILFIFIVDIFTIYFFQSRVPIIDIFALVKNGSSGFSREVFLRILSIILIGIITFLGIQKLNKNKGNEKKKVIIIFSVCFTIYALFYIILLIFNININISDNIIMLNINSIKQLDTEIITEEDNSLSYEDYISSSLGEGKNLNIILIFAESLSAIDSANAGGNDKMPGFDKIQKDGITFTNFIENGATSDTAHISTLYGILPLTNIGLDNSPYSGYRLLMSPLPEYLNTQGYMTTFISTASLDFLKQRDFLSGVGFQKIVGEEEFKNSKKYAFNSAPDSDLYDRVLKEIQSQTGKYFIGLQTISFHKTYNTPYGKTEESALKYVDETLYHFYQKLSEIGFFDNGILIILGDHRKPNPAEIGESKIFGPNRYTKSVATIVGSGIISGEINGNIIQHTDFYNSLKILLGTGEVKVDKTYNDVFSKNSNRKRGFTSARYFAKNKYTVSILGETGFTFNNISLLSGTGEIYNYLKSYIKFELGDKKDYYHNNKTILIGQQLSISIPENSLQFFMTAKNQRANGVKFDVSYTKDKNNIVASGEYLYESNCKNIKINNYEYDWIKQNCTLKNGEEYKKLDDMLEIVDGLFDYYFLEIKVYDEKLGAQQTKEVIQTVKDLKMQDRVIFISYSDAAREVLDADSDIIYGWDTFNMDDLDFIGENNSKYFLAPYDMLTPEIVQKAKDLGKEVVTYTVNETGDFQAMKDLGIKIIMSDRIELLQEYNSVRHYPIPHNFEKLNLRKTSELTGITSE